MHDDATFALLDPEFFVSLEERKPGPEFAAAVNEILNSETWNVMQRGVWTYAHPRDWNGPMQGWKLHVSATPRNGLTVLRRVTEVLARERAAFKFMSDKNMLFIGLSKNWPREGGGKFITVYPLDEDHFRRIGKELAEATAGLEGPYILSDRRIPGNQVVFYRYGQHLPMEEVNARGHRVQHVVAPTGEAVSETRKGHYQVPDWVEDPFGARSVRVLDTEEKRVTLKDRFEIHGALKYSNTGGVYKALDIETDEMVVVREARPCTGWINETTDSVALLRKEARILRLMDGSGWTPGFVDEFQVWEHSYLAQEDVKGAVLRDFVLSRYLRPGKVASPRRLFWTLRHLILQLLDGIDEFHRHGLILRDLTATNVLVRRDRRLCFIDFEFSWEREGPDAPAARIHTPGFASPAQMSGALPSEADDLHSLGAIVVEMCSLMAGGLALNRSGVFATAEMMMNEVGLPNDLLTVARGLLDPDPATRWKADDVRAALRGVPSAEIPWKPREPGRGDSLPPEAAPRHAVQDACEAVCRFFEASADPARNDRLWPASPQAHRVNPVCIQFGACGPIEFVRRMRGEVPAEWLDWVEERAVADRCPPGLYVGLAGVALTLAACGRAEPARRLLLTAAASPLLETDTDLYHGAAGVGVAALALGAATGDAEMMEVALRIAERLEALAEERTRGIAWRNPDGLISCGLAEGGSGISIFFTYLGARTGDPRHWELARRALDFEFSQMRRRSGYSFWPAIGGTRRKKTQSPHVFYGTAGVGAAAVRLFACTRDPELWEWARRCAATSTFRWTNKLWQDFGYAGFGELLLDMRAASGDEGYVGHAARIGEVLLPNQVPTRFGTAFPGGALNRVSADFGMGASGIALFLHRLANPGVTRAFYPDHLLPGWGS